MRLVAAERYHRVAGNYFVPQQKQVYAKENKEWLGWKLIFMKSILHNFLLTVTIPINYSKKIIEKSLSNWILFSVKNDTNINHFANTE